MKLYAVVFAYAGTDLARIAVPAPNAREALTQALALYCERTGSSVVHDISVRELDAALVAQEGVSTTEVTQ